MKCKVRMAAVLAASAMALGATGTAHAALTPQLFGATGVNSQPGYLVVDASGNVYTANGNSTISKITSAGVAQAAWASGLAQAKTAIAVAPDGTVYAGGDTGTRTIDKFAANGSIASATSFSGNAPGAMQADGAGNLWYANSTELGKLTPGGSLTTTTIASNACGVATDAAGNVFVAWQGTVRKFNSSGVLQSPDYTVSGSQCSIGADGTYVYVITDSGMTGGVARITIADGTVDASWVTGVSPVPKRLAVGSDGHIYTANWAMGGGSHAISKISPAGEVSTLATMSSRPEAIALDALSNVYVTVAGGGMQAVTAGVYKITQAAPAPTPTPSPSPTPTPTPTPTPGPALPVTSIPKEITVEIAPSEGGAQEITAEVPCEAPEGQLLDRCSVNMTAPAAVMLGQGDGIRVRADRRISIGKATVNATAGKKVIVVKVKINQRGRKALKINTKIKATIGLTAITVSNERSTGSATSEMRLPTQLLSPESGIFASNLIVLNRAGVAFVNRLATLLPKTPKAITCIGFADNTGVPGDNRWLGERRALAVCDALAAKGVKAKHTRVQTKAATSPRDDNATQKGRDRNRRVSIRITY